MDLVIDLGNTNKKLALFDGEEMTALFEFPDFSLDLIRNFVQNHPGIGRCILSSVIDHPHAIADFLGKMFFFIEMNEKTPVPLINKYFTPETLGKDRLAASVAGAARFPGHNILIITMGSCITYDFVNFRNEYLGGAISPGMNMRFMALHTFTGKLPLISYQNSTGLTGVDTRESILSGVVNGIVHEMEGTIEEYLDKYQDIRVILSGGDMIYFEKRFKNSIFAVPNIVLQGLYQILAFNANES